MTHSLETKRCNWTIKLILLNVESTIPAEANDDCENLNRDEMNGQNDKLEHLLLNCKNTTSCRSAQVYLSHNATNNRDGSTFRFTKQSARNGSLDVDCAWEKVCRDILKFTQRRDQYLALTSVLLKSRAFHETYTCISIEQQPMNRKRCVVPIIDLPRTKYNKPYIPTRSSVSKHRTLPPVSSDETVYPFSLSHQFPFAGLARLVVLPTTNIKVVANIEQHPSASPLLVGMDIVVFDTVNFNLYDSVLEFCHVFRESFSVNEWRAICTLDNDHSRLRELYLRWTVKEAYTKALGVGMGCDFASFETLFDELIATDQHNNSVWNWVSSQARHCTEAFIKSTATVVDLSADQSSALSAPNTWLFFFLPMSDEDDSPHAETKSMNNPLSFRGCGGLCIGPFGNAEEAQSVELNTEWTNLATLMAWHGVS